MLEILLDYPRTRAKNARHVQFVTDLKKRISQEVAAKFGFTVQWTGFDTAANNEIAGFKEEKGYLKTVKIEATDRTRDCTFKLYRGIALLYEAYGRTEEEREAGQTIAFAFHEAGDVTVSEYGSETAEISDLVEKFRTEPYVSALATIGLEGAADALEEANEAFNTIYLERNEEERDRAFAPNMKSLRSASDKAIETLFKTINALYAVNELVTKDEETRTELGKIINDVNTLIVRFRKTVNGSSSSGDTEEEEPTPEPTTPEITKFYPKENANPDKPLEFPRNKTAVLEGKGLKLVDSLEGKKAQLVLINYVDQRMPHEDSAILLNTDEKIEFTMMYDAAEGQYNFQIETYPNGTEEVVTIKYPETITLV